MPHATWMPNGMTFTSIGMHLQVVIALHAKLAVCSILHLLVRASHSPAMAHKYCLNMYRLHLCLTNLWAFGK